MSKTTYCYITDYVDEYGTDRYNAHLCCGIEKGRIAAGALMIVKDLERKGNVVTAVYHVPGNWTLDELMELAQKKTPGVRINPLYFNIKAVTRIAAEFVRNGTH